MELIEKLVIAKQAVDLCSENLGQWILHGLVTGEGFPRHLQAVRAAYGSHCRAMQEAGSRYLPDVKCTQPAGGMFVWLTLPRGLSAMELFHLAIENGVAFVPGQAFFALGGGGNTLRLNFTRAEPSCIDDGIRRLGMALDRLRKSV
jgi:2-aminoadipate transaminase